MRLLLFLTMLLAASVNAMSGQALVTDLNARYFSTVAQCSNGTPAYYCSGVLLRAVDYSTFFKFWDYGSQATKLGSVAFTYVRSDIGSTTLNGNRKSGFILKDQTSALAAGKALSLRCIFPFPTESLNLRADHGCGFAPGAAQAEPDLANCAKLSGSPVTTSAWLRNFLENQSLPRNQCSLSTVVAAQFKASLEAHTLMGAAWTAKPMEVLVKTWDESKPEKLPVEAVFYDASTPAKVEDARKFQREYYLETSIYVPIVRLNLTDANKEVFSYATDDQRYGEAVAERLNIKYSNVTKECNGWAAYYCSGVLLRVTGTKPAYHAWDPSDNSIKTGGVSFSYLRKDLGTEILVYNETQGFIFKDFDTAERLGSYPTPLLCSYPSDANTYSRPTDGGCGPNTFYPVTSRTCLEVGVTTLDSWKVHYRSVGGSGYFSQRNRNQCSFTGDKDEFALSLEARNNFERPEEERPYHNEVMLKTWPRGIPEQLPIAAFFYLHKQTLEVGIEGAKYAQKDYFNVTGNLLPVIRVTLVDGKSEAFSYHASEQSDVWK
ncbi:hypothetical protein PHLH6_16580 [Pseudomonas sp. Seg1]|uniref:hypothetical protein n=1 Tax=Pseudomonas sp. Seg1 TaxID=2678259 RepID=UPI001BB38085|nr:hypothetical protein [Pseudomonas sp. Seg1]BBP69654.1 hypothetical protein PHLH6_16580 [Pseudomonas sp. Seg1]